MNYRPAHCPPTSEVTGMAPGPPLSRASPRTDVRAESRGQFIRSALQLAPNQPVVREPDPEPDHEDGDDEDVGGHEPARAERPAAGGGRDQPERYAQEEHRHAQHEHWVDDPNETAHGRQIAPPKGVEQDVAAEQQCHRREHRQDVQVLPDRHRPSPKAIVLGRASCGRTAAGQGPEGEERDRKSRTGNRDHGGEPLELLAMRWTSSRSSGPAPPGDPVFTIGPSPPVTACPAGSMD